MKPRIVLSLEQALSLPYATLRFAQLGWRVIRVEAVGGEGPLRCSARGRAAELASLTAFAALRQLRRVSSRCALRAPTSCLRFSPPLNRPARVPPAALQTLADCAHATAVSAKGRAGRPWSEFWRRGAQGSRPARAARHVN